MLRIGSGHDTHRLAVGRPLVLGGIKIHYAKGLVGYSDGDVVLHAITDALLGAAAFGDIGDLFPDSDAANLNRDSADFVKAAMAKLAAADWRVINADVTIFAQEPKLGPSKAEIGGNVAKLLGLPADTVSIKAKTGEHVGHIGRREAIGCHAVVLIEK